MNQPPTSAVTSSAHSSGEAPAVRLASGTTAGQCPPEAAAALQTAAPARGAEPTRAELDHLRALATLGELTGTATHEFNNIVMMIMNYAKLGLRDRSEAARDKALNKILDASQRAARISGTILAQARNRQDSMQPTDLAALVADTLELLTSEMRKYRVKVETAIDPATPAAIASGNQIQRVLINLLTNARQAMPQGGTILVSLAADAAQGEVVLTVRDTGTGIPREQLPQIFEPFFSTKTGPDASGKGGTGLGLAACKEIIDAHQGRIRVESTVGRGTAFLIRLKAAG